MWMEKNKNLGSTVTYNEALHGVKPQVKYLQGQTQSVSQVMFIAVRLKNPV